MTISNYESFYQPEEDMQIGHMIRHQILYHQILLLAMRQSPAPFIW
jgi:hypothetical protein